jgi:transcriptional regulator with XRE-family HTH domain
MMAWLKETLPLIHERIRERNYTQGQIGELLGIDQAGISRRLAGQTEFKLEEIAKLLSVLGIPFPATSEADTRELPRLAAVADALPPAASRQVARLLRALADDLEAFSSAEPRL